MRFDAIIDKACERAGHDQFDSDSFREGLAVAAQAIDDHPKRTEQGKVFLEELLTGMLVTRLQVADWARRNPAIKAAPISRPVFIMGMPRTGTTMASYLLASDRNRRRSMLKWEVSAPVPPPRTENLYDNPIIDAMRAAEDTSSAATHYEAPDGPTECTFIVAHDLKSLLVETMLVSPAYADFILQTDLRSAYDYHRLFLQLLQSEAPGTWSLKQPSHTLGVDILQDMYPDARFIWTHRDPYTAAGSLFSLAAGVHGYSLPDVDYDHIRATYPRQLYEHIARPMALIDRSGTDPFYHLHYDAMMADPLAEMRKLYAWLGDEFSPEVEKGMQDWLTANPQGRFGKHSYNLEKFGVTKSDLEPYFADYVRRFDVALEG